MLVPVEVSAYALSSGKEYAVHCFNLLKQETPGQTYLNRRQISLLSANLNKTQRTVRRYLQYMEGAGWIEPDGRVYIIKSWKRIFSLMGFQYTMGTEADITKVKNPQAFYAGIVLGRLSNFQQYKERAGKGKAAISSHGSSAKPGQSFFPVADRALAEILGISHSKANKLKKLASGSGYIDMRYNFYPYELDGNFIQVDHLNKAMFRQIFDDIGHKMRIDKNGRVSIQDSDLIRANLKYKKSWNYL